MEFRKRFSVLSCVRQAEYDSPSTAVQISTNRIRSGRQPKPGPLLQNQGAMFLNQGDPFKTRGRVSKPGGHVPKPGNRFLNQGDSFLNQRAEFLNQGDLS